MIRSTVAGAAESERGAGEYLEYAKKRHVKIVMRRGRDGSRERAGARSERERARIYINKFINILVI